jgi:hypothetical protein
VETIARRHVLKLTLGLAAACAAVPSIAMPVAPLPQPSSPGVAPEPAIASQADLDAARPETVQWRRDYYWRRRYWRRRYWRRRYWRRVYWRRRYWRRRYWRRRWRWAY